MLITKARSQSNSAADNRLYGNGSRLERRVLRLLWLALASLSRGRGCRPAYRELLLLRSREYAVHGNERDSCRAERRARTEHVLGDTEV